MRPKNFLQQLDEHWYKPWDKLRPHISLVATSGEKWQTLIPLFEQISAQNAVFIMVYNLLTGRLIYTVDKRNITGYDASLYFADNWYEFSMSNMHPDYLQSTLIMDHIAIELFNEGQNIEKNKIVINVDGMYKRVTGEYFRYLQQTVCLETDDNDNPFIFLSYVHNISHLKKDKTANLVITTPNETKWWNFNFDKNSIEPVQRLSKQEKKILSHLAEGESSKKIAQKLFISPLTVDKHRRNLLNKTNCVDTTGMITYCRMVGLL